MKKLFSILLFLLFASECIAFEKEPEVKNDLQFQGECTLKLLVTTKTKYIPMDFTKQTSNVINFDSNKSCIDNLYPSSKAEKTKIKMTVKYRDYEKILSTENPDKAKRSFTVKFEEPEDYINWGVLANRYLGSKTANDQYSTNSIIYIWMPAFRRIMRKDSKSSFGCAITNNLLFCSFTYDDFFAALDRLVVQNEIVLSGEKITVLDRNFKKLNQETFSTNAIMEYVGK